MRIVNELYEGDILKELSIRFKQYRISSDMTQKETAKISKVSVRTISRFEKGEDIGLLTIVRLFKALGLAKNLEALLPDMAKKPSHYFGNNSRRQRARAPKKIEPIKTKWKWGDEE